MGVKHNTILKRAAALALTVAIALSLYGCGGKHFHLFPKGKTEMNPDQATFVQETLPMALNVATGATEITVQSYVCARLKTEEFITADFTDMSLLDLLDLLDEAVDMWDTVMTLTESLDYIAGEAVSKMETDSMKLNAPNDGTDIQANAQKSGAGSMRALQAGGEGKQWDPRQWAEELTAQYDAIKGGQALKQLAQQLGVDAKEAYKQLTLAQEIIYSNSNQDAAFYDKLMKAAQATKTACKVGLFVTGTIVSGGGTLTALATSNVTLLQGGVVLVQGVDCIIDVAATGSTIVWGEDSQVAVGFEDIKSEFAPVSSVIGLAVFNGAETGDQLAYLGDTLTDWVYEGKIFGVKVAGGQNIKLQAQTIDITGSSKEEINNAIIEAGFGSILSKPPLPDLTAQAGVYADAMAIGKADALDLMETFLSIIKLLGTSTPDEAQQSHAPAAQPQDAESAADASVISGTWQLYAAYDQSGNLSYDIDAAYSFVFDANGSFEGEYRDAGVDASFSGVYDCSDSMIAEKDPYKWYYYATVDEDSINESGTYSYINMFGNEGLNHIFKFRDIDGQKMLYDEVQRLYFIKQ
jgi:uncharacterized protein YidB (DUF937 family)